MCLLLPLLLTQVCLALDKRVLLEGLGASPQQVLLDHRANHPAFNVTRWGHTDCTQHQQLAARGTITCTAGS